MKSIQLMIFAAAVLTLEGCNSYRILGVFPLPAPSHFQMFEALMKGLARKGHQVDVVSAYPQKTRYPNYTDIIQLSLAFPPLVNNLSYHGFRSMSSDTVHFLATDTGTNVCEILGHPKLLELVRDPPRDPPYDVLVTEMFTTTCSLVIGHLLAIPTVAVSTTSLYPWHNSVIRNPENLAFVPNNILGYVAPMNLWQRFHNTIHTIYVNRYFRYITSVQDDIIRKYYGDHVPDIGEIERNVALVLVNTHVSLNGARPSTSSLIEVGGLHIEDDDAKLSEDLKDWMDSSVQGFVYFTLGSMVTIETFPEHIIDALYKSFKKIAPVRILMKIVNPKLLPPGLPENIRTFEWAPQLKVLKHKNAKAFITHGGLMGTQEAIYCAVPMIGIPLFIDQFVNIDLFVQKKIAVQLAYQALTEESLDHALKEILHNPIYKKSIMEISKRFRDRPMSPMDTAVWWIEYVVRNGNNVLRSPAMDLTWWQIELLDVYLLLVSLVALAIYLAIIFFRLVVKLYVTMICLKNASTKKID